MGLVAGQTVLGGLARHMRGMTMAAIRNKAVFFAMTTTAGHGAMLALVLLQLGHLLRMAGKTRLGDIAGNGDDQWGVRIGVAIETALQFKMGVAFMALAAGGDVAIFFGSVARMAINAAHLALVGPAIAVDVLGGLVMAFDAVILGKPRGHGAGGPQRRGDKKGPPDQAGETGKFFSLVHY